MHGTEWLILSVCIWGGGGGACVRVCVRMQVCVCSVCVCGVWDGGGEDVFERACVRACM